jgi:hypothetical protein
MVNRYFIVLIYKKNHFATKWQKATCFHKDVITQPRGGNIMTLKEVKAIAKQRDLKVTNMKKAEIIRTIQKSEGNTDCFATGIAHECGQLDCLWRQDCL